MVNKLKLKCEMCGREIAHLFLYERKNQQLGYLPKVVLYCNRCDIVTNLHGIGANQK